MRRNLCMRHGFLQLIIKKYCQQPKYNVFLFRIFDRIQVLKYSSGSTRSHCLHSRKVPDYHRDTFRFNFRDFRVPYHLRKKGTLTRSLCCPSLRLSVCLSAKRLYFKNAWRYRVEIQDLGYILRSTAP